MEIDPPYRDSRMKNLSAGTLTDIAAEVLTMNTCVLIQRTDSTVFAWTDCDEPLTVGAHTYSPIDGYAPSANQGKSDFSVDNMEIVGFLDSPAITESDVAMGKWDYALTRIFMVNRNNIGNGTYEMRYGWTGQVKIQAPGKYSAEIRGLSQAVQNVVGDLVTPTCRFKLGDSRCTVNLATYTSSGVAVTSVASTQEFAATALTQAAGYFTNGTMKWVTGNNAGVSMDVQGFAGGTVLLQLPMIDAIVIGDTFNITAGCLKRFALDCVAKFSNGDRFGGFKDVPGIDKIIRPAGV
jgi:uncharacterized phage protein (TIGR02218 family)